MAWQDFKLIGFAPDLPVTTPGTSIMMKGCYPTDIGIAGPVDYANASSSAMNSTTRGGALITNLSNTSEIVAGTATKLYSFDLASTITDRSGAAYNASDTNTWSFTTFGNIVLAANLSDQLQQRTIAAGANFASVGAAPVPKASIVVTVGPTSAPFVMVFDYNDGTNNDKDGWKCSAISDYTGWTSGTNSSATGRLLDNIPGPITAAIPYRDGVIAWKRTGMYVGEYTGPPNIWSWRRISSDVGCIGKNACVEADDQIYWMSDNGVWVYDGSFPKKVPGYIQKYWTETVVALAPTDAQRNFYRAVWDKNKHVIWFLPGKDSVSPHPQGLGFNTVSGLWVQALSGTTADAYPTSPTNTAFLSDFAAAQNCREMISGRWGLSDTGKIAAISFPASNPTQAAIYYGWLFTDKKTSPLIRGVRPHWAKSSINAATMGAGGLQGNLYTFNAEYEIAPGVINVAPLATKVMTGRSPGYLDGTLSAAEVMTFQMAHQGTWEISGISVDIGPAGRP